MQKIIKNLIGISIGFFALFGVANISHAAGLDIITMPSSSISQTSVTLNASFTNTYPSADLRFEWGTLSGNLVNNTNYVTKAGANGTFSATLTGLTPGMTYYFHGMGASNGGPAYGNELSFTTLSYATPKVITAPATNIGTTDATLTGSFDGQGMTTTTWFEYANNSSMVGAISTASVVQGQTYGSVAQAISGLNTNTKYYFRMVAKTSGGTVNGNPILSFTTGTSGGGTGGTGSGGSGTNCSITYFSTNTYAIVQGNSATVSWDTANCISTTLSYVGPVANTGYYNVAPSSTTTYTLTATNGTTTDVKSVMITVNTSGTGTGGSGSGSGTGTGGGTGSGTGSGTGGGTGGGTGYQTCLLGAFWSSGTYCGTMAPSYIVPAVVQTPSYLNPGVYYTPNYSTVQATNYYPNNNYNNNTGYNNANNNYYNNTNTNTNSATVKAVTTSVSDVGPDTAILNGAVYKSTINPAYGYFEYGTTANLGQSTVRQLVSTPSQKLANGIFNLLPDTVYYFRMVAEDGVNVSRGDILYFRTGKPGAIKAATVVTGTIKNTGSTTTVKTTNASAGQVLPQADQSSSLAASAGFSGGFLPGSFIGWLLLFIIILIIILIVRSLRSPKPVHHHVAH